MPTVSELMTRNVAVVGPEDSLQRAAQLMDELNVGSLPVCEGDRLLGMITDRDITVRATSAGLSPADTRVGDVMSEQIRTATPNESAESLMKQMADVKIRRMPVLDDQHRLIGIVSLGDLAARRTVHVDETLREISSPSAPDRPGG